MLQRTKGRVLLALLVVTGLAGTLVDRTLTKDERKSALTMLKDTRGRIITAADGLSAKQLDFKPSPDAWSIADCLDHIALTENLLWSTLVNGMKGVANPELRDSIKMKDEEIIPMMTDRSVKRSAPEVLQPSKAPWTGSAAAIAEFRKQRNEHIKYVRSTTEDLRNHVIGMPGGVYLDAYQMLFLLNGHAERHYKQIEAIRADPRFPKS